MSNYIAAGASEFGVMSAAECAEDPIFCAAVKRKEAEAGVRPEDSRIRTSPSATVGVDPKTRDRIKRNRTIAAAAAVVVALLLLKKKR